MKPLLNLPIRGHWLRMIVAGEKREEYRDLGNAQVRRFWIETFPRAWPAAGVAVFRAGYRPDSPAAAVELRGLTIRGGAPYHPEWGEQCEWHFVLHLGGIVDVGGYSAVRACLAKEAAS